MRKTKKLSIDCVNRVKLEKVEEFQDSIFSDVYRNAHMQIERIMYRDDMSGADSEAEQFCTGNETSNVIAFVGERGMGKSSAMLSFAYFLKKYPYNMQEREEEPFWFKKNGQVMKELAFYTLSKVDVAILTNESLFDVVLARMWTDFSDKVEKLGEDGLGFNHTKESFNSIKRAYTLYYKDERQNKNLTSVKQLQELSRSLTLREEFAGLTASFLECMVADGRIAGKNRYLVIPIDDLDLASEKTMAILEQLRIFLSVPQVIILTTVDIEKLLLCGNKKFSDELICQDVIDESEKTLVRQYSDQYIAKVLPRNSRINMPRYGGNAAVKYVLDYGKYVAGFVSGKKGSTKASDIDYLSFINIIIAKYLNLIIGYRDGLNFPGESLRNIVNKLNELWMLCHYSSDDVQNFVYEWFEKEITILQKQIGEKKSISLWKRLSTASPGDYNEYIIAGCPSRQEGGGIGYGQVLGAILDTRDEHHEKRDTLRVLVLFYSLQLAKCMDEKDEQALNDFFVRNDIFSSFISRRNRFFAKGRRKIDDLLQLDLKYDEEHETVDSVLRKNAQQMVDVFKVFLFCEAEDIIGNAELEISRESGGEKEISGVDIPEDIKDLLNMPPHEEQPYEEQLILRIRPKSTVSRISFDAFFKNAVKYDALLKKYVFWICEKLNDFVLKSDQKEGEQFDALYREVLAASQNGVKDMRSWKKKYDIKGIYDIFPVQDVGVILEVLKRIKQSGRRWFDIDQMMRDFSSAFMREFKEAENNCLYADLGYQRYSEKLEALLKWIDLDSVSSEIKGRFAVAGPELEDTTRIR